MKGLQDFNKVFLLGNLVKDVDLKITGGGLSIASFTLAVNRSYKSNDEWQQEVAFLDITVFGKQAENCSKYLEKGQKVLVEGRIKQESWVSQEGQNRSKLVVIAERVQFLGKPENAAFDKEDVPF
jgi:single-strand DNA-binding protein